MSNHWQIIAGILTAFIIKTDYSYIILWGRYKFKRFAVHVLCGGLFRIGITQAEKDICGRKQTGKVLNVILYTDKFIIFPMTNDTLLYVFTKRNISITKRLHILRNILFKGTALHGIRVIFHTSLCDIVVSVVI